MKPCLAASHAELLWDVQGQAMLQREYAPLGRLAYQLKDMRAAMQVCAELQLPLPLAEAATAMYAKVKLRLLHVATQLQH
jgi:3-hydroxyisobutyrate dehydrogenase-like beta-hydroxyacid dehydrogenase